MTCSKRFEQGFSQGPASWTDFENLRWSSAQCSNDAFSDVAVDEEVLSEAVTLGTTHQRNFEF